MTFLPSVLPAAGHGGPPQAAASRSWRPCRHNGTDAIVITFPAAACRPCPARDKCTTATRTGRQLTLRPRQTHQAITAARAGQATGQWKRKYAAWAGVEGLMAQAAHVTGIRRARYPGLPKTTLEHNIAAVTINLIGWTPGGPAHPWTGPGPAASSGSSSAWQHDPE
jgi:hypothetical protein